MRKIQLENAHSYKGGYVFPSENTVADSIFFKQTYK